MQEAQKLLSRLKRRAPFSVSTDVAGIFGKPQAAVDFWRAVLPHSQIFQLEFLAWTWHLARFKSQLHQLPEIDGIPIGGYHGKMGIGAYRKFSLQATVMLGILNSFFAPTRALLELARSEVEASKEPLYVLVHQPEAEEVYVLFQRAIDTNMLLAVENHGTPGSVEQVHKLVTNLRARHIPAVAVFDIVHANQEFRSRNFSRNWSQLLQQLHSLGPCILHLPIGTRRADSLPPDDITPEMWSALSEVVNAHDSYVVIEHQLESTLGKFVPSPAPANIPSLVERTRAITQVLFSYKLL